MSPSYFPMTTKKNPHGLAIGSPVWHFGGSGKPDVLMVTGETPRSWLVGSGDGMVKVPKNHAGAVFEVQPGFGGLQRYCLTRDAANAMMMDLSRGTMVRRLLDCRDAAVLRAVAEALGMPTGVG